MQSRRFMILVAAMAAVFLGVVALLGAMGGGAVSAETQTASAPTANLLTNGDFEAGDLSGWNAFGNAFFSTAAGGNAAQLFGNFSGGFDVTGIWQGFPAAEGDTFSLDADSFQLSGDALTGTGNSMVMKMAFFDAGATEIGAAEATILDASTAEVDTWIDNVPVEGTAPAGTVEVQAFILFLQPSGEGGSGFVDNVVFESDGAPPPPPPPPPAGTFPPVVADFQGGVPDGWFVYSSIVNANVIEIDSNDVLSVTYDVTAAGFGGFGAGLPSQDWSDYQAIKFDFYGEDSGLTYVFEAQDGTGAVVERFHGLFVDDFTGWRTLVIPFSTFVRGGFQDDGAPDDGFQLDSIAAWVFPLPLGAGEFMLDNVEVTNIDPFAAFDPEYPPGWFQYGGFVDPALATVADDSPYAVPGQIGDNGIISGTFDIAGGGVGFGGFGAAFDPARDWADLDGIVYWLYGHNSGDTFTFELQDGTPGNPVVERFTHTVVDDFDGWRLVTAPWSAFLRGGFQEDGAPNDGLNLIDVRAWAYPLPPSSGPIVLDMFSVFGDAGNITLKVAFEDAEYNAMEGETATITATLNAASAETVTVTYATSDGTAVEGVDYTGATGELVYAPGDTTQAFTVATFDNSDNDDERTVVLTLSEPEGAELGAPNPATLIIGDDETDSPSGKNVVIEDYEDTEIVSGTDADGNAVGYELFMGGSSTVAIAITDTMPAPVPGAAAGNNVMQEDLFVTSGSFSGFTYKFTNDTVDEWVPQDWTSYAGFGFWLYGNNTGGIIFIDVLDNRGLDSTVDDAERWSLDIVDNFTGWQYFEFAWDEFNRKDVGNGAPNDGFNLDEVHGYAFGGFGSAPINDRYYIDDVSLVTRVDMVDDFEDGMLPTGVDPNGIPVGFYTVAGGGAIDIAITDEPAEQVPGAAADNKVLEEAMTLPPGAFAVSIHAFTNETADEWVPVDWEGYEGVCFWLYGHNTGGILFLDVLDNRNPDSTVDDAERWSIDIPDDFSGWQFFQFTWDQLSRKEIGNGAPNDGFNLTEIHGYAIGGFGSVDMGTNDYYYDNFAVWGNSGADTPLTAEFERGDYEVTEGETAEIVVTLNMTSTEDVTVAYASAESKARPDRDFTPVAGDLVIPAGELTASFMVETFDNDKHDRDQNLMLVLHSAENADLGFRRQAVLNILDDDPFDPALIDDFEGFHPFQTMGEISLTVTEIMAGTPEAVPGQGAFEQVLDVTYNTDGGPAEFSRTFVEPMDWMTYDGLSFWFYGSNSGQTYTVELQDNQAATTAETPADEWVMVWSDEFNDPAGTVPNPNYWTYEIGDGSLNDIPGWGNAEFQYYTDDPANAATDGNGNMVLTLDELPEDTDLVCYYGPCRYTSARLISWYKAEFEYGRIESRIKVPPSQESGLWPAFWSLGTNIDEVGWPQTGEIDIMEYVSRVPNEIFGTIHGPGYSGGSAFGAPVDLGEPVANDYHTFAVEWSPNEIHWYLDGQGIGSGINYHNAVPADVAPNEWVFNHPFFLLLNVAIGGNFGGTVSEDIVFPQETLVDYVRVYQAPNSAERFETTFTDNFTGWQRVTLPFSSFERSAMQPDNAPDDGLGLNEVWGYGFRMPEDSRSQAPAVQGAFMLDDVRVVTGVPTAIELESLTATAQADGTVQVEWATSAEVDNAGFNVVRSTGTFADGAQVNASLIASLSSAGSGGSYAFTDASAPYATLNYWLVAVDTSGVQSVYGPVSVVNQAPTSASLSAFDGVSNAVLPLLLVALLGALLVSATVLRRRAR